MGQAVRTTKLALNLDDRTHGGINTTKRLYLDTTAILLNDARTFYVNFFLTYPDKLTERVSYFSEQHQEQRERLIGANEVMMWAEQCTVTTTERPAHLQEWNFTERFPDMPVLYRRSVIRDAIGKIRSYLSNYRNWEVTGSQKKGKPGLPTAHNHPTLYQGTYRLDLETLDHRDAFVRLKVYDGTAWIWVNYPVKANKWCLARLQDKEWVTQSPRLILRPGQAELHITQEKEISAKKVKERKLDPDLVTIGVDLNIKNLAVITVRQHGEILKTLFVTDKGLDQHRYHHLKRISKRQWQSGKPLKGERNCKHLWDHIKRTNRDIAHKTARMIADLCAQYPGSILLFERLRVIRSSGEGKTRRLNRKLANQIRGLVRDYAKEKAFAGGTVTVEVNPHGTSQYCSRCGAKGERFSYQSGCRSKARGGKLFYCPVCHYEANADFNASVNMHHSFYREYHWQPRAKKPPARKPAGTQRSVRLQVGWKKHPGGTPR